jgi:ParB-like nuclease domain
MAREAHMGKLVKLGDILPNPHHNDQLNELDQVRIDELKTSFNVTGFWSNVLLRPHPDIPGKYQQAHGHHRIAAARQQYGDDHKVELPIVKLTDTQMLVAMIQENSNQHGNSFSTRLESVAAATKHVAYIIFRYQNFDRARNNCCVPLTIFDSRSAFRAAKDHLLSGAGIGEAVIRSAANNSLMLRDIRTAIGTLKDAGIYGTLITEARDQARQDRKIEQQAATDAIDLAKQKADDAARKQREAAKAFRDKQVAAAQKKERQKEADEAARDAEAKKAANAQKKADAAARALEATAKAQAIADTAETKRDEAKIAATAAAKAHKEAVQDVKNRDIDEVKENELVAHVQTQDPTFDHRVSKLFTKASHLDAFRKKVTSQYYKNFYTLDRQYQAAQTIIANCENSGWELTAAYIIGKIHDYAYYGIIQPEQQRKADQLKQDATLRAQDAWEKAEKLAQSLCGKLIVTAQALDEGARTPYQDMFYKELAKMETSFKAAMTELRKSAQLTGTSTKILEGELT